jgi:hypothetical protein
MRTLVGLSVVGLSLATFACVGDAPVTQPPTDSGTPNDGGSNADAPVTTDGGDGGPTNPVVWLRSIGSPDDEYSNSVAVDSAGNTWVGGSFLASVKSGTMTLNALGDGGEGFVMKLGPDGTPLAGNVYGGSGNQLVSKVAVDGQNTPYALVPFYTELQLGTTKLTSLGNFDFSVVKMDPSGKPVAHVDAQGPGPQVAWQMMPWGNGGVVLCGGNAGTLVNFLGQGDLTSTVANVNDAFVAKVFGGIDYRAQFATQSYSAACSLGSDALGGFVLGIQSFSVPTNFGLGTVNLGNTQSLATNSVLVAFSNQGAPKWNQRIYAAPGNPGSTYIATMTTSGEVYGGGDVTGSWLSDFGPFPFNANVASGLIYKLSSSGTYIWSKITPGVKFQSVTRDKIGRVLACGRLDADTDLGRGPVKAQGNGDVVVVVYAANGDVDYAASFGDSSYQECYAITTAPNGDVVIGGRFSGTMKMGSEEVTTSGGNDVFLARLKGI